MERKGKKRDDNRNGRAVLSTVLETLFVSTSTIQSFLVDVEFWWREKEKGRDDARDRIKTKKRQETEKRADRMASNGGREAVEWRRTTRLPKENH